MAECEHWWQLTCHMGDAVEGAVSGVSQSVVQAWAGSVLEGMDKSLVTLGTFWVRVPTPDVSSTQSVTVWSQSVTQWLAIVMAAFCLMGAFVMLIWNQRGETVRGVAVGLVRLTVVSASSLMVGQALVDVSDATASWTLEQATGDASGNFATKLLTLSTVEAGSITLVVVLVMGLVGLVANLVQIGMMFVRAALLVLFLSMIPIAAAAAITSWGEQWLRKLLGWFAATIALKPVAALIYAIAVKLVEGDAYDLTEDGELLRFVLGVMMMVLAAFALPALVAFLTPVAGAIGGGGGAGSAAGVAAGVVATGAMTVSRGDSGSPVVWSGETEAAGAAGGSGSAGAPGAAAPGANGAAGPEASGAAGGAWAAGAAEGAGSAGGAGATGAGAAAGGAAAGVVVAAKAVEALSDTSQAAAGDSTGAGQVAR